MANKVAIADGNFLTGATWATADATGTLISTSTSVTALTTGNLDSAVFAPGAITVQGLLVRLGSRASGSPSNKMTIILRNSTGGVDVATTVINVSALPPCNTTDDQGGWVFCRFTAPIVLLAATNYVVRATLDSTSTAVSLCTNGTANNWQHILVTTTTGAPAAGDDMFIGEWFDNTTNPATQQSRSITMDETATTDYGSANTNYRVSALTISHNGTLSYGVAASTNYYLKLSGILTVMSGGRFNVGTSGAEIPRNSTAVLEFDCAADGNFGLFVNSEARADIYGLSRTSAKNFSWTLLTADAAAAATSLTVQDDTGWKNGDEIGIASTTRTYTQAEVKTLNADAGASSLSLSAGLTNAHGGSTSSKVQAEVALLTRNVIVRSSSTTAVSFILAQNTSTLKVSWALLRYMGSTGGNRRAIECNTTSGTVFIDSCAFRDNEGISILFNAAITTGFWVNNNVFYQVGTAAQASEWGYAIHFAAQNNALWTMTNNVTIYVPGNTAFNAAAFLLGSVDGTCTGNRVAGSSNTGWDIYGTNIGTFDNNIAHSNNDTNFNIRNAAYGTMSNLRSWRSTGRGFDVWDPSATDVLVLDTFLFFGNTTANLEMFGQNGMLHLKNGELYGDSTFATTNGIEWIAAQQSAFCSLIVDNCKFGVASGIYTAHTNDISLAQASLIQITARNSYFASGTLLTPTTSLMPRSYLGFQRWNQTNGQHRTYKWPNMGRLMVDLTMIHGSDVSEKLTPNSSSYRLESGVRQYIVQNGATVAPKVWVQKDGSYVGSTVRLILKANPALGVNSDQVLDSLSVGANTWEQLTGTTPAATDDGVFQFVIDCDGVAGNVFNSDWS